MSNYDKMTHLEKLRYDYGPFFGWRLLLMFAWFGFVIWAFNADH